MIGSDGHYPDSGDEYNANVNFDYLDLSRIYGGSDDEEHEAAHVIASCLGGMRPSVIFHLARNANDFRQFIKLLRSAGSACDYPEEAELIGSRAIEDFAQNKAIQADRAFGLIMMAAAESALSDDEWEHVSDAISRLSKGGDE